MLDGGMHLHGLVALLFSECDNVLATLVWLAVRSVGDLSIDVSFTQVNSTRLQHTKSKDPGAFAALLK